MDTPGTSPMYAPSEGSDSTDPMIQSEEFKGVALTINPRRRHKLSSLHSRYHRRRRSAIPTHLQSHSPSPLSTPSPCSPTPLPPPLSNGVHIIPSNTLETSLSVPEEICKPLDPIVYQNPLEATTTESKSLNHAEISVCPIYSATPNSDSLSSTSPPFTFPQPNSGSASIPSCGNRPPSPVFPAPLSSSENTQPVCSDPVSNMASNAVFQPHSEPPNNHPHPSPTDMVWMPIPNDFTFVHTPESFQYSSFYGMPPYDHLQSSPAFFDPTTGLQMVTCCSAATAPTEFHPNPQSVPFNTCHHHHQTPTNQPVMMYPQMVPSGSHPVFVSPANAYIPTPCGTGVVPPHYMMMVNNSHPGFHPIPQSHQQTGFPEHPTQAMMQPIPMGPGVVGATQPQPQTFSMGAGGIMEAAPIPTAPEWISSPYPLRS